VPERHTLDSYDVLSADSVRWCAANAVIAALSKNSVRLAIAMSVSALKRSSANAKAHPAQNQDDLSTTLRNACPTAKARQLSTMIWNRRSLR